MGNVLVLMEKAGFGSMYVPESKLADFVKDGWNEISRTTMTGVEADPAQEEPAVESVNMETHVNTMPVKKAKVRATSTR
jgi:hypothetical protein